MNHDTDETLPIESKELRGISLKTLYALITATALIILTVYGSYSALKSEIQDIKTQKEGDSKYNDLRMRVLEQKVDMNTMSIKNIEERFAK